MAASGCRSRWRLLRASRVPTSSPTGRSCSSVSRRRRRRGSARRRSRMSRRSATPTSVPTGYFAHGTNMHLSHLFEDVAAWYLTFDFQGRLDTTFRPGLEVPAETQTVAQGPDDVQSEASGSPRLRAITGRSATRARFSPPPVSSATWSALTVRGIRRGPPFRSAPTSTRSTIPSSGRPTRDATRSPRSHAPDFTSWCSTPRATTSGASASRWTASCPTAPRLEFEVGSTGRGFNSDPRDDTPSELPRAPAQSPLVPPFGASRLSCSRDRT